MRDDEKLMWIQFYEHSQQCLCKYEHFIGRLSKLFKHCTNKMTQKVLRMQENVRLEIF